MYTSDIAGLRLFALWEIQLVHLHSNELLRASAVLYHTELYVGVFLAKSAYMVRNLGVVSHRIVANY